MRSVRLRPTRAVARKAVPRWGLGETKPGNPPQGGMQDSDLSFGGAPSPLYTHLLPRFLPHPNLRAEEAAKTVSNLGELRAGEEGTIRKRVPRIMGC